MNYSLVIAFGFSILIAGVIALFRFPRIRKNYFPFLYLVWIASFNEVLSFFLIKMHQPTLLNNNIYALVESLLIMWFFKEMGYFNNNLRLYLLIMVSFLLIWIIESMMQRTFSALNLRFSIFYSFIVVLKSIHTVNDLVITETQSITKSALFWICIGFIAYFSFKVLINTFWLYGLSKSKAFLLQMAYIMVYINLFTNLIYAFAVLWIPKRQPSIRLF